jgi:hypothetical protein
MSRIPFNAAFKDKLNFLTRCDFRKPHRTFKLTMRDRTLCVTKSTEVSLMDENCDEEVLFVRVGLQTDAEEKRHETLKQR